MRSDELRDAGSLVGTALDEFGEVAQGVHGAVATRAFGLPGPLAEPARLLHDGIASLAYGSARLGVHYLPRVAGLLAGAIRDPAAPSAHEVARGRSVLGVISGFRGDRMADRHPALAPRMRMRLHGGSLRHLPTDLAADCAAAAEGAAVTGRLVVFIHGLCGSDLSWSFGAEKRWGERTRTYGSKLGDDDGWTPLYVNFNTGLRVSENGRRLAEQLEQLVPLWPVDITEVALVGHSMGGLVAHSAAHQGDRAGHAWIELLSHVVALGTPHLGAPLERFANWTAHQLDRLPESRPLATWLNRRSVGIKDLRFGTLLPEDWHGHNPDDLLADHRTPAPLLPGVAYSVASATLSRKPHGLFAHDLLVQHSGAHGMGKIRSIPFDPARTFHLGGKHHFDLLADEQVYQQLRIWLSRPIRGVTADAAGS